MTIAEWLNRKFLEWEQSQGKRKTLGQFSEFLGVSRISLSDWINGKYSPKTQNIGKIAEKLGPEIYDLVGIPRPQPRQLDEKTEELIQLIGQFSPEVQMDMIRIYQKLIPYLFEHQITDEEMIRKLISRMFSDQELELSIPAK